MPLSSPLRRLPLLSLLLTLGALTACSGDDGGDGSRAGAGGAAAGTAGTAGKGGGGAGGAAGAAGGGAGGAAGKGGSAGAGQGGAGAAGAGAAGAGAAGSAGTAGGAGAGAGGEGGSAGVSGSSGQSGASGQAGAGAAGAGQGGAGTAGAAGSAAGAAGSGVDPCPAGTLCGDGNTGVCAGGECCAADRACGEVCCGASTVCSFQKCVTPGAACQDSTDCGVEEYCEFALGEGGAGGAGGAGGEACVGQTGSPGGKCLPRPPLCAGGGAGGSGGGPLTCLDPCEVIPPVTAFAPTLRYSWGSSQAPFQDDVMMTPIVIQLDDDDCDGKVTERDIPEIVFSTFTSGQYGGAGVLHAISIVGGEVKEKWAVAGIHPTRHLAAGNLDGVTGSEVVGCGNDGRVHAIRGDGTELWASASAVTCFMPAIADLDGDGVPEVIVEGGILDGATGALEAPLGATPTSPVVVSDVTGDGKLDIVTATQIFNADGSLLLDNGLGYAGQFAFTQDWKAPWPAVGDFDLDGKPEVVVADNVNHTLSLWRHDPSAPSKVALVRAPLDINGSLSPSLCPVGSWGNTHGGGPPTVGDFNGDGTPDVALAGGVGYAVFDGKKLVDPAVAGPDTILWLKPTNDCSSASTGSSLFDFNGDGKAEVLYSDQQRLRVYDGPTGDVLFETCNTTATLIEYPIVADVDNDGQADIIVASNAYAAGGPTVGCDGTGQAGIRVFGSASGSWVRTRRVWNQHSYHITNIAEDGTVPAAEPPNWQQPGLNNFRTNKQPGNEFSAPDAIVSVGPDCDAATDTLAAVVRNVGQSVLAPGVKVDFYKGAAPAGTLLGSATTTLALYPAQAQTVSLPITDAEVLEGLTSVYAVATSPAPVKECRPDNNTSAAVIGTCKKL